MKLSNEMKYKYLPLMVTVLLIIWGAFYIFQRPVPEVEGVAGSGLSSEGGAGESETGYPPAQNGMNRPSDQDAASSGMAWFVRCNAVEGGDVSAAENEAVNIQDIDGEAQGVPAQRSAQCEMFQRLNYAETGIRLVEFAIGAPQGEGNISRGVIILPLGIYLPDGVLLQIDDGQSFKAAIRSCTKNGCVSYINLNQDLLMMMAAGEFLTLHLKADDGQSIQVKMSLKGFAEKLTKILD